VRLAAKPAGGQQASGSQGLQITLYTDMAMVSKPEDLCNPPLTVEVTAGSHGAARWNTVDGKRPNVKTVGEVIQQNYYIYRPVTFSRMTPLHDKRAAAAPATATTYFTLGGQVGQDRYSMSSMPQLDQANGHYVAILVPPMSTTYLPARDILLVAYAFPVDAQGIVTLREAGDPNEPGTGPMDPGLKISLADLKQVLASCKA